MGNYMEITCEKDYEGFLEQIIKNEQEFNPEINFKLKKEIIKNDQEFNPEINFKLKKEISKNEQ